MAEVLNFVVSTFQGLYLIFADLFGFGWGLIALSIFSSLLFTPLERWALRLKNDELTIQKVLQPQLQQIKKTLSGQEAWSATQRLYNRYSYHPLKAIRTAAFPLLQLPILFLAYVALSSMEALKGISFATVSDLSQPDNLLFDFALLPFVMTAVNIATTFIGSFSKREQIQAIVIALLFLILLYPAPAALLIYWIMNNVIGLIKAIGGRVRKPVAHISWLDRIKKTPAWVWTLPLCPFIPTLFMWSNNIAFYSVKAIVFSLVSIFLCSLITWFILMWAVKIKSKSSFLITSLYSAFIGFVFCALSFGILATFGSSYRFHCIWLFPILFLLLVKFLGFKLVNLVFLVQISLSLILLCYNYSKDQNFEVQTISTKIQFKQKPNIYYFLCESYQNLDYVKQVFGYDSSNFISQLKKLKYDVDNNVYSNSSYTLGTLVNIFSMNNSTSSTDYSLDISSKERDLIGGGNGNNLLKILKLNGYETSLYFKGSPYYFTQKGQYLDNTDVPLGLLSYLEPIKSTNGFLSQIIDNLLFKFKLMQPVEQDSLEIVKRHLEKIKNSSSPQFFAHRLFQTNHTDSYNYRYTERADYIKSNEYQNGIARGNAEILGIAKLIERHDPNAIVLFLGDHGAWTFRGIPLKNFNALRQVMKKEDLNLESVINDMFYIFSAIKLPAYLTPIRNFSPSNVFSLVFKQLAESPNAIHISENCIHLDPSGNNSLCRYLDDDKNVWFRN